MQLHFFLNMSANSLQDVERFFIDSLVFHRPRFYAMNSVVDITEK